MNVITGLPENTSLQTFIRNLPENPKVYSPKLADFLNGWRYYEGLPLLKFEIVRKK